jgi:hypothetical protein
MLLLAAIRLKKPFNNQLTFVYSVIRCLIYFNNTLDIKSFYLFINSYFSN